MTACTTPSGVFEARAQRGRLERIPAQGDPFAHFIYRNVVAAAPVKSPIYVFIEGDGVPWTAGGTLPATDPTPVHPLALDLMLATEARALYLTRPCYNGLMKAPCGHEIWTSGRYAAQVIGSMAKALDDAVRALPEGQLILVGYSGGGAVATLLAGRLDNVTAVVTIAANLDTDRWTTLHRYLPLEGSLNPATQRASGALEIHLTGGRDTNVPAQTLTRYRETHPLAEWWNYPGFDHVCCWVDEWPRILERLRPRLDQAQSRHRTLQDQRSADITGGYLAR